jgi:hypothetical protein
MKIIRSEGFRAAALLFAILNLGFFPFLWGNKTLLDSAQAAPSILATGSWAGVPSAHKFAKTLDPAAGSLFAEANLPLLRYQYFHEKVAPLWDPYQAYGRPLAANQQSQPFYPLTLALLLHITPRTYNWFLISRLFVAGLACYFYLRFFVSFWPAMVGGIASMLAGYYLLYLTMPQLSVEVLVPASLLAAEYLLRKRNYGAIVAFAVMLALVFLGGMPESELLLLTLLYAYLLFRIFSDSALRTASIKIGASLATATCAGLALAAFFLLPFWELLGRSYDGHQPQNMGGWIIGLYHDSFSVAFFTYFFPLLYGPPSSEVFPTAEFGLRNYVGLVGTFLLLIAIAALVRRKPGEDPALAAVTWFFSCSTLLLVLKRFGFPGLNSLGALPLFQMLNFPKYDEALLSASVAILAAIGLERLLRRDLLRPAQAIALLVTALLIPAALWFSRHTISREIAQLHVLRAFPIVAIAVPAVLLTGVAIALVFSGRGLGPALVALLTIGMWANYIAPAYYWFNRLPRQTRNPYLGAPYVDFLQKNAGNDRIFGRDALLFPNWAGAFQLQDIRDLDAMYEQKYLPFVRNFFRDQKWPARNGDLVDRFHGLGTYLLTTPLAERLLQLSSLKYIVTVQPFTTPNRRIDEILAQNRGHLIPGKEIAVVPRPFILSGEARDAVGEHPPYERLPYRIKVPDASKAIFVFSCALDPAVYDKTSTDGVGFIIELKDPAGRITKQFSRYIDPKHNASERRWIDGEIDLSPWRNQTVELLFTTTPGPVGNSAWDWAAWSNFHFVGEPQEGHAPPFRAIYNQEVLIYRYDRIVPRAAVYHHIEPVHNENAALDKLADPSLDIFQSVVLNESSLTPDERSQMAAINNQPSTSIEAASIRSYQSQDIQIDALLDRSGVLVLNDTAYPGWTAAVDGHPAAWTNANYLFRGVFLPPGKHTVRFRYQPQSFRRGATISLAALGLLAIGFLISRFSAYLNRIPTVREGHLASPQQ